MRNFNIDWPLFVSTLPVWEKLSRATQERLIGLKPNAFENWQLFDEADARLLLSESLLRPDQNDKRLAIGFNDRAKVFSKVFRALGRNSIDADGDRQDLQDYAADLLTNEERVAMSDQPSRGFGFGYGQVDFGDAAKPDWPLKALGFKDAKAAHQWEKRHLPAQTPGGRQSRQFEDGSPYFKDKNVWEATRALVAAALDWTDPLPLAELPTAFPKTDENTLWLAVTAAIRYLWLFPRFRNADGDLTPVIGVWPRITLLRHRPKPTPPRAVEPRTTFHGTVLLDDMQAVLIATAAEPLRILANGDGLYQKDLDRLAAALAPLPDWVLPRGDADGQLVGGFPAFSISRRIDAALHACRQQKLLKTTEDDRGRLRITTTDAARQWLALSPTDRLARQLEPWREDAGPPTASPPNNAEARRQQADPQPNPAFHELMSLVNTPRSTQVIDGMDDDEDDGLDEYDAYDDDDDEYDDEEYEEYEGEDYPSPFKVSRWRPAGLRWGVGEEDGAAIHWAGAVAAIFADHDPQDFLCARELLNYHARMSNPLLGHFGPRPKLRLSYDQSNDELMIEEMWCELICEVLFTELLPLGAIELAQTHDVPGLRLHPIGRYMLGLTDTLDLPAAPTGQVIVQPNFDVVFLGPSPLAEAAIGRFAQRKGQGVGTLFKLTRDAALAAAAAGLTAERALADLDAATSKPLPKNVERELRGWFDATRRVKLRKTIVIDAPDEPTAAKVHAAAGKHARRLAPQVVEITTTANHAALIRKLKTHGVFVET